MGFKCFTRKPYIKHSQINCLLRDLLVSNGSGHLCYAGVMHTHLTREDQSISSINSQQCGPYFQNKPSLDHLTMNCILML